MKILRLAALVTMAATALALAGCLGLMNEKPVASFVFQTSAFMVTFDASHSRDIDGTIVKYVWDFDDGTDDAIFEDDTLDVPFFGGEIEDTVNGGETASHLYTEEGTYAVSLIVTDNSGATDSTTRYVIIGAKPDANPVARFVYSGKRVKDEPMAFNGNRSNDPDGHIVWGKWDFGDGKTIEGSWDRSDRDGPAVNYVEHTYKKVGEYTVTLIVRDDEGCLGMTTRDFTIAKK